MAKQFTAENFEEQVLNSKVPVMVDFWAVWCGPCQMIAPTIEEIAEELEGKIVVGKVNVDEEGELAEKYGIVSIPTILIFKEGKVANKIVGLSSKQELIESL